MALRLSTSQKVLHTKALAASRRHRRVECRLIAILAEVDNTRLFQALGHSSLFVYAVKSLRFSESTAYAFITVARKTKEVPCLQAALKEEKLSVARASRIVSVLTAENATSLIEFAARQTARETDQEVARLAGKGAGVKLRALKVSDETLEMLKRAQSLMASRKKKHLPADETLKLVLAEYLERHDPVKKAERAGKRNAKKDVQSSVPTEPALDSAGMGPEPCVLASNSERAEPKRAEKRRRTPLTAHEKHAVFRRDGGRCTFVDAAGERCASDRWLHIHHVRPVSLGGTNELSNLVTYCSFHHELVHQLSFPIEGQINWIKAPARAYVH